MKTWKHKDYPKRLYKGSYTTVKGKKVFRLTTTVDVLVKKIKYTNDFKSWQEAVAKGWERS